MPKNKSIRVEDVVRAVKDSLGLKTVIARGLKTDLATVNRLLEKHAKAAQTYEDERERVKDMVEAEIIFQCQEGNSRMLMFYAKTRMKDRGFADAGDIGADAKDSDEAAKPMLDLSSLTDSQLRLLAGEINGQKEGEDS